MKKKKTDYELFDISVRGLLKNKNPQQFKRVVGLLNKHCEQVARLYELCDDCDANKLFEKLVESSFKVAIRDTGGLGFGDFDNYNYAVVPLLDSDNDDAFILGCFNSMNEATAFCDLFKFIPNNKIYIKPNEEEK